MRVTGISSPTKWLFSLCCYWRDWGSITALLWLSPLALLVMLLSLGSSARTHSSPVVYFQVGLRPVSSVTKPSFCLSWEHLFWNDCYKSYLSMRKSCLWKKLDKIFLMVALGIFHPGDDKWIWVCCIVNSSVKAAVCTLKKSDHNIGVLIFWVTTKRLSLQLPGGGRERKEGKVFRAKPTINYESQMVFYISLSVISSKGNTGQIIICDHLCNLNVFVEVV